MSTKIPVLRSLKTKVKERMFSELQHSTRTTLYILYNMYNIYYIIYILPKVTLRGLALLGKHIFFLYTTALAMLFPWSTEQQAPSHKNPPFFYLLEDTLSHLNKAHTVIY